MIIRVTRIPRPFPERVWAFTVWPFIVVERDRETRCVLAHERVHYEEQRRWLVVPWLIAYGLLGLRYGGGRRHPMERRAYAVQDACEGEG